MPQNPNHKVDMEMRRFWFISVVRSHLNRWYIWGGDSPLGFDCSGLVVEGMRSVGLLPLAVDMGADGFWNNLKDKETSEPIAGCLAFWFDKTGLATHVAVCLDGQYCITADGGSNKVKTVEDAMKYNAFIKIRRIDHRTSSPRFVDPFK